MSEKNTNREETIAVPSDFADDANRLLYTLDLANWQNTEQYYRIITNANDNTRIDDIIVMEATPTGALRQERQGLFARAQFKILESYSSDSAEYNEASQYYIWCDTGYEPIGADVKPNEDQLETQYGYKKLSIDNVIRTITMQAESIEDYDILLQIAASRDLPTPLSVINKINRQVSSAIKNGISSDKPFDIVPVFELIAVLEQSAPNEAAKTLGKAIELLFRAIPLRWGFYLPQAAQITRKDKAIKAIEDGIKTGVLADEPRVIDRIFRHPAIYEHPFAVNLIHKHLTGLSYNSYSKRIFGIKRDVFTLDFIIATLNRRLHEPNPKNQDAFRLINQFVASSLRSSSLEKNSMFKELFDTSDKIKKITHSDQIEDSAKRDLTKINSVITEQFIILSAAIQSSDNELAKRQLQEDAHSAEIINIIQSPTVIANIGASGVKNTVDKDTII